MVCRKFILRILLILNRAHKNNASLWKTIKFVYTNTRKIGHVVKKNNLETGKPKKTLKN